MASSEVKDQLCAVLKEIAINDDAFLVYSSLNRKKYRITASKLLVGTSEFVFALASSQTKSSVIVVNIKEIIQILNFRISVYERTISYLKKVLLLRTSSIIKYAECVISFDSLIRSTLNESLKIGFRINQFSYADLKTLCEERSIVSLPWHLPSNSAFSTKATLINTNSTLFKNNYSFERKPSPVIYIGREKY